MKKLLIALFALVIGCFAADAQDLVTLGIYLEGDSSVAPAEKLPQGVYRGKSKKTKKGMMSFPFHVDLGKTQTAEVKLKVVNGGTVSFSLYAFRREKGKKNVVIPVKCQVFEINGKPVSGVPCTIKKWRKMTNRELQDGDVVTIKLEFEKPEK